MILLCDIDHCISDAAWRDPYLGDWEKYHLLSAMDKPILPTIRVANAMALLGWRVIMLTSRPERWRMMTMEWLIKNIVLLDDIIMRANDDYRPCAEYKLDSCLKIFGSKLDGVGMIWDNREDVLEPFRQLGVTTMLVGAGQCYESTLDGTGSLLKKLLQ
jgi:hypothetical protein